MKTKVKYSSSLPLTLAITGLAAAFPAPAVADDLPYGPDTCVQGFVWREARGGDDVCVAPGIRDDTARQNASAAQNREPNGGAYGPATCKAGFVWREAFDGDTVCVDPGVRDQAKRDNAAAQSRYQRNHPDPQPRERHEDNEPPSGAPAGTAGSGDPLDGPNACNPSQFQQQAGQKYDTDACMLAPD
ncbi:hypothetical protein K3U94_12175 [Mycolicibacter heraklionensis]|uniref:Secreted protein n=1 Tax=Mycolicibacter heraklionensis TaxID=512402 RepID=A0A9X7WCP4_9MYCO|nr:hypothetical protein [Mycolicibacter heraklionensis]QZA05843.1 hypothetical protein K3U94_12175 [Mycolicibacter heraklionensis]